MTDTKRDLTPSKGDPQQTSRTNFVEGMFEKAGDAVGDALAVFHHDYELFDNDEVRRPTFLVKHKDEEK